MNKSILILLIGVFYACAEKPTIETIQALRATESFPEDVFLDTVAIKKALIVVAHDDDDCMMSGTVAKLTANGWNIKQLSLVTHTNSEIGKNPAHLICNGNQKILEDGFYRLGLDTMKNPYVPIPYDAIEQQFLKEKVSNALVQQINEYAPSVIFTLDNVKGGYGHPEHLFISNLVLELFQDSLIHNQRIYQSVYTDHMEHSIVDTWLKNKMKKWGYPNPSELANELYGIDGMPEPNVQVTISAFAQEKKNYLMAYPESARKNLRKFIPYFEEFDAVTYFGILDKEFFRIIK